MSAGGVIPEPAARGQVQEIGRMEDVDGVPIVFSINLDDTVRITIGPRGALGPESACADLDHEGREEFSRLYFEACHQADGVPF